MMTVRTLSSVFSHPALLRISLHPSGLRTIFAKLQQQVSSCAFGGISPEQLALSDPLPGIEHAARLLMLSGSVGNGATMNQQMISNQNMNKYD